MRFTQILLYFLLATGELLHVTYAGAKPGQDIRLVLQITVNGLRGDLLDRYQAGFGKDGFNLLLRQGTVYTNAHYQHANTETIVAHATLATGATPAQHGMIGNVWFDREAKELAYNIEDAGAPLLPTREESTVGEQVEQAIADALTDLDGIEQAVPTSSLSAKTGNPLLKQVRYNHHLTRSGDIYVIQEPYWFLFDEGPIPSMHGSPWRYDTHVPVIFSGPGIDAQYIHRPVHPVDVAPTIAALLGMSPPAAAIGVPLKEALQ